MVSSLVYSVRSLVPGASLATSSNDPTTWNIWLFLASFSPVAQWKGKGERNQHLYPIEVAYKSLSALSDPVFSETAGKGKMTISSSLLTVLAAV